MSEPTTPTGKTLADYAKRLLLSPSPAAIVPDILAIEAEARAQERERADWALAALAECRQLNYELSNLVLARERQRDAAREDADRLAEALESYYDGPPSDRSDEQARDALAAHDALVKP
jgi:hypothetical protein